ncbi:MAG: hypothetical protein AAF944_04620 [Bacteroidota bacterium]
MIGSNVQVRGLEVEIGANLRSLDKGLDSANKKVDRFGRKFNDRLNLRGTDQQVKGVTSSLGGLTKAVGVAFAANKLKDFAVEITNVRAEFQKYEAILTNSLGNSARAQAELARLGEFAAQTPFQIDQLTDSFIKLTNRGLVPTNTQLRGVGDFAASVGKEFGQVNEAILDVTNSERWNELGIKVKASGDKITGSFRGVTLEFERSERGALEMVTAFGQLQGVAGTMESVSSTLGGQMSNLGDQVLFLKNNLGQLLEGPASGFLSFLSGAVAGLNKLIDRFDSEIEVPSYLIVNDDLQQAETQLNLLSRKAAQLREIVEEGDATDRQKELFEIYKKAFSQQAAIYADLAKKQVESKQGVDAHTKSIAGLQQRYAELEKDISTSLDPEELRKYQAQLIEVGRALDRISNPKISNVLGDLSIPKVEQQGFSGLPSAEGSLTSLPDTLQQVTVNAQQANQQMVQLQQNAAGINQPFMLMQQSVQTIFSSMSSNLASALQGWKSFGDALSNIIGSLVGELVRLAVAQAFTNSLKSGAILGPGALAVAAAAGVAAKALISSLVRSVPALAEGGIVTGPTYALIGEGGQPEVVFPLSKLRQFIGEGARGKDTLEYRISGQDLIIVMKRAQRANTKLY